MALDLEKLERLAAQATPGPWEMVDARAFLDDEDFEIRNGQHCIGYGTSEADSAYIVAACNAVPELVARVRELEVVEESLARNLADTAFCPLCLIKDCPQYGNGDLGMGAFEPELVDREQCKKSIIAHARKGAKEFIELAEQAAKEAGE